MIKRKLNVFQLLPGLSKNGLRIQSEMARPSGGIFLLKGSFDGLSSIRKSNLKTS